MVNLSPKPNVTSRWLQLVGVLALGACATDPPADAARAADATPDVPIAADAALDAAEAAAVDAGPSQCDGAAVDLRSDPNHCGACGRVCSSTRARAACVAGACVITACLDLYADCDGNPANGCEVYLPLGATRCGTCGSACSVRAGGGVCEAGLCRPTGCLQLFGDCDGDPANGCEAVTNTVANCGACGRTCAGAHATPMCAARACSLARCAEGYEDCDGDLSNGCERAGDCGGVTFRPTEGACRTQSFVAPAAGIYRISASGGGAARGGARMRGDFELAAGDVLAIVVGRGGNGDRRVVDSRGAGGTFVVRGGVPLLVAGGSGGLGSYIPDDSAEGSVAEFGNAGGYMRDTAGRTTNAGTAGGTAGGDGVSAVAGGGLGFNARVFTVGGACEDRGGAGGNTILSSLMWAGGGGGGGYSGGGAGRDGTGFFVGDGVVQSGNGGGGGSFNRGARPWNLANFNPGDGEVTIWQR